MSVFFFMVSDKGGSEEKKMTPNFLPLVSALIFGDSQRVAKKRIFHQFLFFGLVFRKLAYDWLKNEFCNQRGIFRTCTKVFLRMRAG